MSYGTTGAPCEHQIKFLSKERSPQAQIYQRSKLRVPVTNPAAQIGSHALFPPPQSLLRTANLLCRKMSLGCVVPLEQNQSLLHLLLSCLENCCSETDRWCLCHSVLPLRYLCQLIFPLCLAVVCETGPHHSSLINGEPSLRLVLAPPSSSKRGKKNENSQLDFFFFK